MAHMCCMGHEGQPRKLYSSGSSRSRGLFSGFFTAAFLFAIALLLLATQASAADAPSSPAPSLSWLTRSRLTSAQLDALGLREGTSCPAVPYYRIVTLHDGPGAEEVSVGRVVTPHPPLLLFGVPMFGALGQNSYGRFFRRGHTLVIDAFAAEVFITVTRRPFGSSNSSSSSFKNATTNVYHLSTIELTCRSPIYRVSCEARYLFTRPNTRLTDPTLVLIHPLEGRTTTPLNGISAALASALSTTAAVPIGQSLFDDLVNIEYLSMPLPTAAAPCTKAEHWLRTIPAYVESAVLSGLAAAVGGDTTSRALVAPTVVAGRHLRVTRGPTVARRYVAAEDSAFSSSSWEASGGGGTGTGTGGGSGSGAGGGGSPAIPLVPFNPPIEAFTMHRLVVVIDDAPPFGLQALKGATWMLVVFIAIVLVAIATMVVLRRGFISAYRDAWTSPEGRQMIFGNATRVGGALSGFGGADGGAAGGAGAGDSDDGEDDEEGEEDEEDGDTEEDDEYEEE